MKKWSVLGTAQGMANWSREQSALLRISIRNIIRAATSRLRLITVAVS